jgi:hypothetical protein
MQTGLQDAEDVTAGFGSDVHPADAIQFLQGGQSLFSRPARPFALLTSSKVE